MASLRDTHFRMTFLSMFLLVFLSLRGFPAESSMFFDYESAEAMMKVIQALHNHRGAEIVEPLLDESLKFKAYQVSNDRYTSPERSKENQVTLSQFRRFMLSFSGDQIDTQGNRRLTITEPFYKDAIDNPEKFQEALKKIKSIPSSSFQDAFRLSLHWLPKGMDSNLHVWILFDIGGSGAWAFQTQDGALNIGFNILHMLDESGQFDEELFLGILAHEIHHLGQALSDYFKGIEYDRLSETSPLRLYSDYMQAFVMEGMAQKFCNNAPGVLSSKPYPEKAFAATQLNLKDWEYFQQQLVDIHNRAIQDLRQILSGQTFNLEKFESDYADYWTWAAGEKEGREFTLGRQYYYGSELVGVINAALGREALFEGLSDLRKFLLIYNRSIRKLRPKDFEQYLFPEDIIRMILGINYGSEKVYPLSNLDNPTAIVLNENGVYVEDGTTIKLFNRKGYNFIKAIGSEGQGPGEFQDYASPQILPDYLLVSSTNKVTYFSLAGEFIKDVNTYLGSSQIRAVGDNFVGFDIKSEEDDFYVAYLLFDSEFKPLKELHRGKWLIHKNNRRDVFEIFFYDTYQDKIVMAHRKGFMVDILDSSGGLLHSISREFKPVPFTNKDREKVIQYWREERGYERGQIDLLEKRTDFPNTYPPIQTCCLADGIVYVITYKKRGDKLECLLFNMQGEFIKTTHILLNTLGPNHVSPFTFDGSDLYQLIYNYEKERWELHISQVD